MTTAWERASEDLEAQSEFTNLAIGEEVKFVVEDVEMRDGRHGEYRVLEGQTQDGEPVRIPCWHTALDKKLEEKGVRKGDVVSILYRGKQRSDQGREYHAYSVGLGRD